MRSYIYAALLERLREYRACRNKRCGYSAAEMSAAANVLLAVIFFARGIIGVTGTGEVVAAFVIG